MLGKLLKYEIPAMGRKLLPLYAAWAVTAVLLGIETQGVESSDGFIDTLTILLYTGVATAILVLTVVMIVQRYSRSLLGDEAYFNQVLPVSVSEHIGNKLISASIWVVVTVIVAILTGILYFIGMGLVVGFESYKWAYIDIPKGGLLYIIEFIIVMIACIVKSVMQIYAAITIGHQAANHTTLASIGAYIGVLVTESFISRALFAISPAATKLFDENGLAATKLFDENGLAAFSMACLMLLVVTAAFAALYFFICKYLMEKKLNLA